jgi:uncharacterized protein YceK
MAAVPLILTLLLGACTSLPAASEPTEGVRVVRAQVRGIT